MLYVPLVCLTISNGNITMSSSASDCVRIMRAVLNVTLDWTDALVIATKLAHCGVSPVSATAAIYLLPTYYVRVRHQESTKGTTINLHVPHVPTDGWPASAMCEPTWMLSTSQWNTWPVERVG